MSEIIRCNNCSHYEGVHDIPGCAPCTFWKIGMVMWDDFCSRAEPWDGKTVCQDDAQTQRLKDEIRRLDNENAALRKMLTAAALVGREGW